MKKKIALFFGGRSLERDISVITALQTLRAIDKSKYDVVPVYIDGGDMYADDFDIRSFSPFEPEAHPKVVLIKGTLFAVKRNRLVKLAKPSAALVCCHGGEGENGVLQALLEYNSIPYSCSSPLGSAIAMDKATFKTVCLGLSVSVLPYETATNAELSADFEGVCARLEQFLGYPMLVKPASLGSSIGIFSAKDREELKFALDACAHYDKKLLIERMLTDFIEVNCAAIRKGDKIVLSNTEQPLSAGDFLSFEEKYMSGGKLSGGGHIIPAPIGSAELVVKAYTEQLYRELELDGVVRMDFLIDNSDGKVYINEINSVPGSMAFYLFDGVGISFRELTDILIEEATLKCSPPSARFRTDVLSRFRGGGKISK